VTFKVTQGHWLWHCSIHHAIPHITAICIFYYFKDNV